MTNLASTVLLALVYTDNQQQKRQDLQNKTQHEKHVYSYHARTTVKIVKCTCRHPPVPITYMHIKFPLLLHLSPASLIDIFGRIFTIAFDDTPEDPPLDVITRVTVGNRLCNHVNEDGELYV